MLGSENWQTDMNPAMSRPVMHTPEHLNPNHPQQLNAPAAGLDPLAAAQAGLAPTAQGGYQRYREMTIDELLLENRVIFLVGEINHQTATGVIMRLLHLQNTKRGVDINLYINCPGGTVDDTLAIYDTMQFLDCDVQTYCIGKAMSGGAIVLAAGTAGKRFSLPHAKVMIHQPYGGVYGQTTDVQIQAEEILKTKRELNELMAHHTGQSVEQVEQDSERDRYFSAQEAKDYGIVDEVIAKNPQTAEASS
jgi:ATP-dependent Clp protease protease subunit